MTMSSGSNRLPRRSTVSSVILPAGNITQTARGLSFNVWTTSSSDATAVAPSFASASRGLALASNTTQVCPAFIRRRDMLPPIFPNPIIPICIAAVLLSQNKLFECSLNGTAKLCQTRIDIFKMNTQRTTAALHQYLEVAARLRGRRSLRVHLKDVDTGLA